MFVGVEGCYGERVDAPGGALRGPHYDVDGKVTVRTVVHADRTGTALLPWLVQASAYAVACPTRQP